MRITGLLALVLFLIIVLFVAPAASHAQTASLLPETKVNTHEMSASNISPLLDEVRRHRRFADALQLEQDGVCYTMRTYVMAREDRDSDTTHMVRYTRCLPAWKLQFKSATEQPSNQMEK